MSPGVPCCGSAPVCGLPSSHVTLFSLVHLQSTKSCSLQCCHMQLFFFSPKVISCLFSILKPDSKLIEEARNSPFDCFESFNNYLGAQSFADVP